MTDKVKKLIQEAEKLFDDNEFSKLSALLDDHLLEKEKNAELFAWAARAADDVNKKLYYIKRSLEIDDKCSLAYVAMGRYYFTENLLDQAIAEYDKAIALDPNNFRAYNNKGEALHHKKEYKEAIKFFTLSLQNRKDTFWRPHRNISRAYYELAIQNKNNGNLGQASKYIELAISNAQTAVHEKENGKEILRSYKKNLQEYKNLIDEAIIAKVTMADINSMRDEIEEKAQEFRTFGENFKKIEKEFRSERQIKALEDFFEKALKNFELKTEKAEKDVLNKNVMLIVMSMICIAAIASVIYCNEAIIHDKAFMVYMISLTAIVLVPVVWMLKLAIKKRDEMFLLETEYRHKTALASSLYSFRLTLGKMYNKDTTYQAFNTIFGNNPTDLLADDKSIRIKNKKEQDYPHLTSEIAQKVIEQLPTDLKKKVIPNLTEKTLEDISERVTKPILDRLESKSFDNEEGAPPTRNT